MHTQRANQLLLHVWFSGSSLLTTLITENFHLMWPLLQPKMLIVRAKYKKKLQQKVSQLLLVGFNTLFNILKVYQSWNSGKVFFKMAAIMATILKKYIQTYQNQLRKLCCTFLGMRLYFAINWLYYCCEAKYCLY